MDGNERTNGIGNQEASVREEQIEVHTADEIGRGRSLPVHDAASAERAFENLRTLFAQALH